MLMDATGGRSARLRWLIVLIVLLAVVPVLALHVLRLQANSEAALQAGHARAAALAEAGADSHRHIIENARNLLDVLARIPVVRGASLPECRDVLKAIHEGRKGLTGIFVVDTEGKRACGASPVVRSLDVSDREYFQNAVAGGKFMVSNVIVSRVTGTPIVVAVLPLYDGDGKLQAVLGTGLSLTWINEVAAEASARFGGMLMVLDGTGRLIAYQPDNSTPGVEGQSALVETILRSRTGTFEAEDPQGIQRIFGVARLPDSSLTVAVGLDRNAVLGPIEARFHGDLLFLLLVAAGSIGAALLVAEFGVMRGVRALKTAALRLKAGRMGLRVSLPGFVAAELHDLAATYNAMTAEFERLAYLDRLTGLPNRRYLERQLHLHGRERSEWTAPGQQAVLAIDIDGFKPVNDSHGHAVGDRVLAIIARRIAAAVNERGMLFRVGGDEFVAVVPLGRSQGRSEARALGEEIRLAMEQAIEMDGLTFPVACSVGVALVPEDAKNLSGALVVADAALYEAKRAGRNRVVDQAPPLAAELPVGGRRERARQRPPLELGAPW